MIEATLPRDAPFHNSPIFVTRGTQLAGAAAAVSASAHLLLIPGYTVVFAAVALLVMGIVCLTCAVHLWSRPGRTAWLISSLAGLIMLAGHTSIVHGPEAQRVDSAQSQHSEMAMGGHHRLPETAFNVNSIHGNGALLMNVIVTATTLQILLCMFLLIANHRRRTEPHAYTR